MAELQGLQTEKVWRVMKIVCTFALEKREALFETMKNKVVVAVARGYFVC